MPQHVIVIPYDRTWPERAAREAASLRRALGENCLAVHHIGSTAVEGLAAKPILDFLPVVRSLAGADACRGALEALGYEYLGEFGIPGRRYLRKGGDERTHQVHIFAADDRENIVRHLAVRDYLRTHPAAREAYGALKTVGNGAAQYAFPPALARHALAGAVKKPLNPRGAAPFWPRRPCPLLCARPFLVSSSREVPRSFPLPLLEGSATLFSLASLFEGLPRSFFLASLSEGGAPKGRKE